MVILRDMESGQEIGRITEEQLQFLIDQMEEEDSQDTNYYISGAQLDYFEEQGADGELLALLRKGLGQRDGYEVEWEMTDA
jgi:hypothetical protein